MSPPIVSRRFELHADSGALKGVQGALNDMARTQHVKAEITRHRRFSMVSVRLTGLASAVSAVRECVPRAGVDVLRDWLEVPTSASAGAVYPDLRALLRIDPEERSRNEPRSGEPVVVAIVDSGITVDHPDLADHLWTADVHGQKVHGARCMDGEVDYDVTDQDGHGTMLAGTILATANRVRGIQLMAVKFFDVMTQPAAANAAAAIRFAVAKRPAVVNLSFDLGIGSNELQEAVRSACEVGALVVIAAGNTGSDDDEYPLVPVSYAAEYRDRVIVVMATDWYDEKPTFSNFGTKSVDLAAPGVGVWSTLPPVSRDPDAKRYGRYTGTSAAAAHVAGAAALLKYQNPQHTAEQIKQCLMDSVDTLPRLKCVSRGRLNLGRALARTP